MKLPNYHVLPIWQKLLVLACCWLGVTLTASAQTTGSIQGRVFNPATQEYVRNAEVRIAGTNLIATTEGDGSYQLANVSPGAVSVEVSYTGYKSAPATVNVAAGQVAVRDFEITAAGASASSNANSTVKLEAFTVSTEREGNSKAIMDQKRNMNITTTISSDVFGDVTDGNVGEFLKMLPGVDIDYVESETRGPRLGGMDGQYVGFSVDGMRFANADANRTGDGGRATSFEAFSISSVESIEINLSNSPDQDASNVAGSINMRTRRAFERKGRRIGYNGSMNLNSEEFSLSRTYGPSGNKQAKARGNFSLEMSDSLFNQRFGYVVSINHVDSYTEQYRHNMTYNKTPTAADPRPLVITALNFKDGNKNISKDTYNVTMDWKATPRLVLSGTFIYNAALGEFYNRELTFNAAANNANVNLGRSTVLGDGVNTVRTNGLATNTSRNSALAGGNASKVTVGSTMASRFEYKIGSWTVDGSASYSRAKNNYEALERGHTRSNDVNSITSDFVATRPENNSHEWTIQQTSGADWFNLANRTNPRVTNEGRYANTDIWAGDLNVKWVTPLRTIPTTIKVGGKWSEEAYHNGNETSYYLWQYIGPGGGATGSWAAYPNRNFFSTGTTNILTLKDSAGNYRPQSIPRPDDSAIGKLFNEHPEYFINTATADNYYNAYIAPRRNIVQTAPAGYWQADFRFTKKLSVRTGIRWELTENDTRDFDPLTNKQVAAAGYPVNTAARPTTIAGYYYQYLTNPLVNRKKEYDNFFPMISTKYQATERLQFSFGINKSISRPPIDSLGGAWLINEDAKLITGPNPNLLPEYAKKYTGRVAYYFEPAGQLSLTLSQVNIRNSRVTRRGTAEEFGLADDPEYSGYEFQSPFNEPNPRRHRNAEIAYNQQLPFRAEALRGITVNASYTRSYADVRRSGMLPNRVATGLSYRFRSFSSNVGVVWRDNTPWGAVSEYGYYRRHDTKYDLGMNFRLNKYATVFVQGRNIFNDGQTWMETPAGNVEGQGAVVRIYENYGANWVFGVRGQF